MQFYLPTIFEKYNRVRGNGRKIYGLSMIIIASLIYMALAHFLTGGGLFVFAKIAGALVLSFFIAFMWLWGSKFWRQKLTIAGDDGFFLAIWYANYCGNPKDSLDWKDDGFECVKFCAFAAGGLVMGYFGGILFAPTIGAIVGLLVAKKYQREFRKDEPEPVKRSEIATAPIIAYGVIALCIVHGITNLIGLYYG